MIYRIAYAFWYCHGWFFGFLLGLVVGALYRGSTENDIRCFVEAHMAYHLCNCSPDKPRPWIFRWTVRELLRTHTPHQICVNLETQLAYGRRVLANERVK